MSVPDKFPKISVVTPSFNQGDFIEDTILSVIGQGYPNLEYIVIDGGSTDNTIEVLKKYQSHFAYWVSEKDNGQASAINRGFALATGDIYCWLNSDDMFLPGTLKFVSDRVNVNKAEVLIGNCIHVKEGTGIAIGSDVAADHCRHNILWCGYILQPSSFWTKQVWKNAGPLDEKLKYMLDWDWFIRAKIANAEFKVVEKQLSIYRIHPAHKSSFGGVTRVNELRNIYRKYHLVKGEAIFDTLNGSLGKAMFARKFINLQRKYLSDLQNIGLVSHNKPSVVFGQILLLTGSVALIVMYPMLVLRYSMQEIRDVLRML